MKKNIATGQGKIYSIFNGNKLTQNDIQSIIKYSQVLKSTGSTGEAWRSSMLNCSVAAKQYVLESKKAGKTTEEMIAGLKEVPKTSSVSEKALRGLAIAGNIVSSMLIGLAIQKTIQWFKDLANASKIAKENAEQFSSTLKETQNTQNNNTSTIEEISKEYATLSSEINGLGENIGLTSKEYSRYHEIANQVANIMPNLIQGYDEQGNAILTLKGNLVDLNDEYDKYKKNEAIKQYNEKNDKGNQKVDDVFNDYNNSRKQKGISNYFKHFFDSQNEILVSGLSDTDLLKYLNELYQLSPKELIKKRTYSGFDNKNSILKAILDTYGLSPNSSEKEIETIRENISSQIGLLETDLNAKVSRIGQIAITYTKQSDSYWEKLNDNQKVYISSLFNNITSDFVDENELFEKDKLELFVNNLISSINENKNGVSDAFHELFSFNFEETDLTPINIQNKLKSIIKEISETLKVNEESLKKSLGIDFESISNLTDDYNKAIEKSVKKFKDTNKQDLINFFANNSINTQEEIDRWLEIAQAASSAAEAEKQYLNQDVSSSLLSLPDAIKKVNGFKEGDTEVIGLIEEYELLQEVLSDTGNIQEETYEKLLSCSSKYATAIRTENGRITVNTSKLKAVAKSRQLDTKEAIRQTLALKKQEWVQWNQGIENYNGTLLDNIQNTYGNIDALQQQITQYELLVNSVDEASNAFKRFEAAQSVDEQDMFTTAQNAFDLVNETLNKADSENYGKTNSKKFQYGMELLADDKDYEKLLNAESMEDYIRISKEIVKTLSPLFTENEGLGVDNLFKRADAIVDSGDIPKNDKEWADKLNTSVEMFQALKQRANLYEYNNREYFSSGFTNKLDEYQSRLSNVQSAQEALNECTDTTSNEYKRLSKELDDAKQKYNEFKNETADTVEDAYTGFIHSGAKSKGSFSDYLKQSMGMEDSDITGMIDVLLDKSKSLQENLSNMHPDSTAYELYKKQLDDVNSLIASLDFDIDSIDKTKSLEDKISQYKELAKEAEEYKKTLETEDSGSESYKEAAQELERISVLMNELRDPLRLEVNSNISEIESQISQLDEKLKGLNESLKHASGSNEAYAIHMDIKGAENEKAKLEGQKSDLEKKLKIIVDDTEAAEKTEAIQNEKIDDKNFEVNVTDNATSALHKIENIKLSDKSLNVNVKVNDPAGINITGSGAFGSAQNTKPKQANADGTFHAFAQGTGSDVSIAKDEKALVNELGEEGIVRNGKLIPVKGGAQFINLKRGDIIFNHKQMEQLKKNGYATGRGKLIGAHAFGTMNAYAGTDTYTKYNRGNVLLDWRSNPANPKNNPKKPSIEKEKAEEEKEAFEEVIDWIERRIQKFQRLFDKWIKQAETTVTKGFINKYYKKAFKTEKKELDTYGKAYNRYMKEANATGLSKKYRNKVKNGTIDIENIKDEDLANKIQKYQEWYDKAIESTTSFVETAEELYNLPLDKAATKIEKFKDAIDLLDKKLNNAIGHKAKNTLIDQQTREEFKTLNANAKAQKESKKNLKKAGKEVTKNSILNSHDVTKKEKKKIKEAVKNGKEIDLFMFKEGSKAYNAAAKYNEALKANKKATQELSMSQEEYNAWLVEASKLKFDNIADDYEKKIQLLDHQMTAIDNRISEIEASGKNVNRSYYDTQKKINAQTRKELMEEKSKLEENLSTIKKGTDEWYDAFDQIQQVSSSISDCEKETYNLNNAINQLHFDLFDDISESIGRIITEQEFLQSLFVHEKTTSQETGNFTEAGIAKLGSLSASYYASKNRAEKDGEEVKELQRMLDSGSLHSDLLGVTFNSIDDLQERLDETYTKWQNDIKETYGVETAIADLMKERYQAQLDLLKELIDAKKEALNAEKDLHDYHNTINEKTNDIATIQKQIAAYSGDTSEESLARLQKLQKELEEKKSDLKETEYDRYISDQQDMLDKLYEEYEELVTKKLEDFMGLVSEGLEISNENTSDIYNYIEKIANDNNYIKETKGMFDSLSKDIKTNVDDIIKEIAKKNTDNSGVNSNGQGDVVADSAKPSNTNTNSSNGSSGSENSSNSDTINNQRNLAMDFVAGHLKNRKKTSKKKSEYGAVNKKIFENKANLYKGTGKVLKHEELIELAKLLKVKYDNNTKNGNLYKKLQSIKFPGFRNGGIVSVDDIERQVRKNGDDGIASVRNGESILTPVQTELFKKFTDKIPDFLSYYHNISDVSESQYPMNSLNAIQPQRNVDNVIHIDNINLPNVNNAKQFADELLPELQKNKSFENLIGGITTNRMDGFGRFDKFKPI